MEGDKLPRVSIIIPMRNEEAYIGTCLQSVVEQDYPVTLLEVLIVDGMSEDSSRNIVQSFSNNCPYIRLLENAEKATTCALNIGIREATGDIIIRVDAHCLIEPDYVRSCVRELGNTDADNVGGPMRPIGKSFVQKAIALAMSHPFGVGGGRFHYSEKEMFVDTVYLGAYRREVFERIGLYDEEAHYSEDDELNYRITRSGGRILLSPRIRSHYYPRTSLAGLWRQFFSYGMGKTRTMRKHGRPITWRQLIPPFFVLSLIAGFVGFLADTRFALLLFGVLGSYFMLAVIAAAKIGMREGRRFFLIMPVVFAVIHASYGMGFLTGIAISYWADPILKGKA
ncbi:MAG: glycosyltransferase family 2 protein [Thermodesulfobacteriota bacterium]|nr:glycosyltransferase family 2 protein [Thermodesulfobacteriota bacterium]